MLAWRWQKGKPKLKSLSKLPSTPLHIPQPDGTAVPIELKAVTHSEKKLGVWTNPVGDFTKHLEEAKKKGANWAEMMRAGSCPPRDVWLGLRHQLYRQMSYGSVAMTHDPDKVEAVYQSVYYQVLSPARVNQHTRKEFRMLSRRHQGLAMPNPNTDRLGDKIQLLHAHWGSDSATGNMLKQAYEVFQVESGLGGDIFRRSFRDFGVLATHGFFRDLWQLCDRYDVTFRIHERFDIPLLREGSRTIMDLVCDQGIWTPHELDILNRVRKFLDVHDSGNIVECDGMTVKSSVLSRVPSDSIRRLPVEKPLPSDFRLWINAVRGITSYQFWLYHPLGRFLSSPHTTDVWFISVDKCSIFHQLTSSTYEIYQVSSAARQTRFGAEYSLASTSDGICPREVRASVHSLSPTSVTYHSSMGQVPDPHPLDSILDVLGSWGNRSLWRSFQCDGDGSWIYRALKLGSLVVVHDGSYMPKISQEVCAAAFVIHCPLQGKYAHGTWVEKTTRKDVDNYRAEILGGIGAQLVVKAALENRSASHCMEPRYGCDNLGVVSHGNQARRSMLER